jgi:hypothetical protein
VSPKDSPYHDEFTTHIPTFMCLTKINFDDINIIHRIILNTSMADYDCYTHLKKEWDMYVMDPIAYELAHTLNIGTRACHLWRSELLQLPPAVSDDPIDDGNFIFSRKDHVVVGICFPEILGTDSRIGVTRGGYWLCDCAGQTTKMTPLLHGTQPLPIAGQHVQVSIANLGRKSISYYLLNASFGSDCLKAMSEATHTYIDTYGIERVLTSPTMGDPVATNKRVLRLPTLLNT